MKVAKNAYEYLRRHVVIAVAAAYAQHNRPRRYGKRSLPASGNVLALLPQVMRQVVIEHRSTAAPPRLRRRFSSQRFDDFDHRVSRFDQLFRTNRFLRE